MPLEQLLSIAQNPSQERISQLQNKASFPANRNANGNNKPHPMTVLSTIPSQGRNSSKISGKAALDGVSYMGHMPFG